MGGNTIASVARIQIVFPSINSSIAAIYISAPSGSGSAGYTIAGASGISNETGRKARKTIFVTSMNSSRSTACKSRERGESRLSGYNLDPRFGNRGSFFIHEVLFQNFVHHSATETDFFTYSL